MHEKLKLYHKDEPNRNYTNTIYVDDFVKHQMPSFLPCIFLVFIIMIAFYFGDDIIGLCHLTLDLSVLYICLLFVIRNPTVNLQGNHRIVLGQFTHLKQVSDAIYWPLKLLHPSTTSYNIHTTHILIEC